MAESSIIPGRVAPSATRAALPRLLLRPWVLALAAAVLFGALELGVRALDASRGYSLHARTAWYWLFEQDPFLGYRGRPYAYAAIPGDEVRHGPEGFRDDRSFADVQSAKGRRLVVCVGDANTYGLAAGRSGLTYPAALERELRALSGDPRWVVFNAGVPGYTSHEILELIKLRLLKLKPEVIVSMSLANDHEHVAQYLDDEHDYNRYPLRMAPWAATPVNDLLMGSALVGRLAERWRPRYLDDLGGRYPKSAYGEATERGLKLYLDDVALTAALCRRSSVALMWVDQPIHYSFCSYGPTKIASVERTRKALRELCRQEGAAFLEGHEKLDWDGLTLSGDLLLASNESVLGRVGYERLAKLLAPQILAAYTGGR